MEPKFETPHINVDYFEDLTGDISDSQSTGAEAIGGRLKSLREDRGMSLDKLSNLTGFDADFLAKIENREISPQLGTVIKLSKALETAFGGVISGIGDKPYAITRKADQKIISRSTSQKGKKKAYTYKSLAPEVKGRHMEALIVQLEENPDKDISVHDGEEFIYVLSGRVALDIGDDSFELDPGDSAYYHSRTPHMLGAKNGNATILAVLYDQ